MRGGVRERDEEEEDAEDDAKGSREEVQVKVFEVGQRLKGGCREGMLG